MDFLRLVRETHIHNYQGLLLILYASIVYAYEYNIEVLTIFFSGLEHKVESLNLGGISRRIVQMWR